MSSNERDATTEGPGDHDWGQDNRSEVGGLGGRPVANNPATQLFLGGGGGAGDSNNNGGGWGGRGGGLVWVVADTVAGSGSIRANGQNGWDAVNEGNDGAGGGGAGGTVVVAARALGGVSIQANGGSGGNQYIRNHGDEAEGPGGGGGGGYIAVAGGTVARSVSGGSSGWTDSRSMAEFRENGATAGGSGQLATVSTLPMCLPSDLAIAVTDNLTSVDAGELVTYTVTVTNNGPNAVNRAKVTDVFPGILRDVSWTCAPGRPAG